MFDLLRWMRVPPVSHTSYLLPLLSFFLPTYFSPSPSVVSPERSPSPPFTLDVATAIASPRRHVQSNRLDVLYLSTDRREPGHAQPGESLPSSPRIAGVDPLQPELPPSMQLPPAAAAAGHCKLPPTSSALVPGHLVSPRVSRAAPRPLFCKPGVPRARPQVLVRVLWLAAAIPAGSQVGRLGLPPIMWP